VATWSWPVSFGRIARFPAVGTSKEVAEYLGRLQHKGKVKVRIKANHTSGPALTWNVVGEIIGEKRPEEVIIAGAHFDGHDIAVGASDDAAGTCVVLEAARLLARHKKGFKRSVRFIAFPAEDVGDFGSAGYVLQHLDEMNNIRFMFNLDSGPENTTRPGLLIAGWPDSIPFFKKMASDMGQPIPLGVGFGSLSDHVPFALRGIHTAWLRGGGFFSGWRSTHGWGHTKADTEDKVDIRDMREAVGTIARVLFRMATVEELPFSRKSQEEIKAMLKEYSYDKLLETMACYPAWLK
jgi:Zn-dependent M28 family amino/carboxypeptidase